VLMHEILSYSLRQKPLSYQQMIIPPQFTKAWRIEFSVNFASVGYGHRHVWTPPVLQGGT